MTIWLSRRCCTARIGDGEQRARMPFGDQAISQARLDRLRQFQQAQGVGDCHAALADTLGDLILGQAELFAQMFVSQRFFQCIQIGALHIFDQRHLQHLLRCGVFHHDRHGLQPGQERRSPAALARDQGELIFTGALDDKRLNQAMLADGIGQFTQGLFVELHAGLMRIGRDGAHRRFDQAARGSLFRPQAAERQVPSPIRSFYSWPSPSIRYSLAHFCGNAKRLQACTRALGRSLISRSPASSSSASCA